MDIMEAMEQRHSVRKYEDKPIEKGKLVALNALITECNKEGGLNLQLVTGEKKAFGGVMSKICGFGGVKNYIAVVGKDDVETAQKLGYYGEKIVLEAQMMGLNTCWAAGAFKKVKNAFTLGDGEKAACGIAIGYGAETGKPHKCKDIKEVSESENPPDWFVRGVKAALLAPTGMNMQNFKFTLVDAEGKCGVRAQTTGGMCGDLNTGIAMYHFEVAAGKENFNWIK
ncbi:MAG: nitroreductase [Clostridia bacterium]|nr:nitroreductase [Clostridia bacterium]